MKMRHAMVLMAAQCALAACAEPVIKVERKPWGADYTLVSSDGPGDVTLVSVRPKCTKYASQMANMYSDDEYGVGVRAWDIRDEMVQEDGELKVVVKGGRTGATASVMRKGDRLLCRDGREWLVRDGKRRTLAKGVLERPLPVLDAGADVVLSCADPSSADARVLVSTRRVARSTK